MNEMPTIETGAAQEADLVKKLNLMKEMTGENLIEAWMLYNQDKVKEFDVNNLAEQRVEAEILGDDGIKQRIDEEIARNGGADSL